MLYFFIISDKKSQDKILMKQNEKNIIYIVYQKNVIVNCVNLGFFKILVILGTYGVGSSQ